MHEVLKGIRVVEVAQYVFVPIGTGVLSEWGADVIKVEHPVTGDVYRGLRQTGALAIEGDVNYAIEHANRGKRSVGIDLTNPEGRALLGELLASADVFATNYLPRTRRKLRLDVADVRADNPRIVYARGSGLGERGPEREDGGFDFATFWARAGSGLGATPPGAPMPSPMPSGAYGDGLGGLVLAGGVSAALLARERTGEAPVVDLSLLGLGTWAMGSAMAASLQFGTPWRPLASVPPTNALAGVYRTGDGRFIALTALQGFHQFPAFCRAVERTVWLEDPRFASVESFSAHSADLGALLGELFAGASAEEWRQRLSRWDGVWEIFQDTLEVAADPQTVANGHIADIPVGDGSDTTFSLVRNPVQFDEQPAETRRAPEAGQHTEEVLLDLGLEWDRIAALKEAGAIN